MIKKYIENKSKGNRKNLIYNTSIFIVIVNILLTIVKIIIGYLISSVSLIADGINNLSDTLSSVIGIFGIKLASKPADKEHPFGHGRAEYLAALLVGILIIILGFSFIQTSYNKLFKENIKSFNLLFNIMLISMIVVKLYLYYFSLDIYKKTNSIIIKAVSKDSLNDVFITLTVLISIIVSLFINMNIDAILGLILSLYIMYSGFSLINETFSKLLGEAPSRDFVKNLHDDICSYENIINAHDIIVNSYGPEKNIVIVDIEIPYTLSLLEAHNIVEKIETDMNKKYDINLSIHVDPMGNETGDALEAINSIESIIDENKYLYSQHDLIIKGDTIYFDLTLEGSIYNSIKKEREIKEFISGRLNKKYNYKITLDKRYYI